jgi:hypothetical protein
MHMHTIYISAHHFVLFCFSSIGVEVLPCTSAPQSFGLVREVAVWNLLMHEWYFCYTAFGSPGNLEVQVAIVATLVASLVLFSPARFLFSF